MGRKGLTYARAGVSVNRGDRFVDLIKPLVRRTRRAEVVSSVGGFAAATRIPSRYVHPLLVSGTDGVGTKVLLARRRRKYDTVGIDLVAMCVNDILTVGAEPLFFLDYLATDRIRPSVGRDLVAGIARGCRLAGCALVGGETAEMPRVYRTGDFDLAGFCVGVVERSEVVDGRKVRPGDSVIGLPSSGIHSNGYTLVRAIVKNPRGKMGIDLLRPTRIYVRDVLPLLWRGVPIRAMAHITGGGLPGNLPRVLPRGTEAILDRAAWKVPDLFRYLQKKGRVSDREMFRTFNMGIGFVLVIPRTVESAVLRSIRGSRRIGEVGRHAGRPRVRWRN